MTLDLIHGDAQHILDYKKKESYDCVNSSHCLEHMKDVPSALSQWWGLVKPGGYLVTVVPHEDLYEQGIPYQTLIGSIIHQYAKNAESGSVVK